MLSVQRWLGLKDLIVDAVDQTTAMVADNHRSVARRVFGVLKLIEPIEAPVRAIEIAAIHRNDVEARYKADMWGRFLTHVLVPFRTDVSRSTGGERYKRTGEVLPALGMQIVDPARRQILQHRSQTNMA